MDDVQALIASTAIMYTHTRMTRPAYVGMCVALLISIYSVVHKDHLPNSFIILTPASRYIIHW